MKKLLYIIVALVVSATAFAKEECSTKTGEQVVTGQLVIDTKVPKHLKGAVIIVRLADGTESTVPAEKFKVVPRKQQYLTTDTQVSSQTQCLRETEVEKIVKAEPLRNRISVSAGKGPKGGLSTSRSSEKVKVETSTGAVGGLQYQRSISDLFDDRLSVGGQIQTNKSIMGTVGVDF